MHKKTAHTCDIGTIYTNLNKYIHDMLSHNIDFMAMLLGQLNSKGLFT